MAYRSFRVACVAVCVGVLLSVAGGCQPKRPPLAPVEKVDYSEPLPAGQLALEKISPTAYPDFSKSLQSVNLQDLRRSAQNSVAWFSRPSNAKSYPYLDVDHDRAAASARAMIDLIDSGAFSLSPAAFNQRIADEFDVYQSLGARSPDGSGYTHKVLFTGYFTPTYDASLQHGGAYQWPIYRRPADLITDATGDAAGRKSADGSIVAYYTRQ